VLRFYVPAQDTFLKRRTQHRSEASVETHLIGLIKSVKPLIKLNDLGGMSIVRGKNHPLPTRIVSLQSRRLRIALAKLDAASKDDKKKIAALNKDKAALAVRIARTDAILAAIGGRLSEEEARYLILKKLYDLASGELNRYLNAEKRGLIAAVENLWDKYAVSSRELECQRTETLKTLDGFLKGLGYLEG
jgi:hypothetical protein